MNVDGVADVDADADIHNGADANVKLDMQVIVSVYKRLHEYVYVNVVQPENVHSQTFRHRNVSTFVG